VKNLRKTVFQIEADFGTIAAALEDIDKKETIRDKDTNAPKKVLPDWKGLRATYGTLRVASQETAMY